MFAHRAAQMGLPVLAELCCGLMGRPWVGRDLPTNPTPRVHVVLLVEVFHCWKSSCGEEETNAVGAFPSWKVKSYCKKSLQEKKAPALSSVIYLLHSSLQLNVL